MKAWLPYPVLSLLLVAVWLLLAAELSVAHIVLALFLAWGIPLLCRPFLAGLPHVRQPLAALRLVMVVTYDIVVANVAVARLVLGPPERLRPAFVEVPLTLTQPMSISLLASIITMTPGTVSSDLSKDNKVLIVHALDCSDTDALVSDIKQRYEKPLLEIFGC
ncbi:Na+/H+ antiporter subunit E [Zwartia vadi]|uniref:Na+/H+ antiporter subunit E n=1 Tax=Zwartia vadi TaxID=3058168 RepID=UPI0025B4AEE5|nr:Na+/H+ antiporter subunit E [Zwartia vadi]MDN3988721.1 Na+/H+ antiporter subunit E [Zwartia vadi]